MMKKLIKKYREILVYGIIGLLCSGLDFVVYTLLCLSIPFLLSNIISTHCGIICSFFLNRHYNFKVKDKVGVRFLSFYLIGLLGLLISEVLLHLMVNILSLDPLLSKIVTIVVVALIQFVLNKYISFRKTN